MNKKEFKFWSVVWSVIWAAFTGLAWYSKEGLGTIATLGGIALMFAWMYEQMNLEK
jgi:hypothetical protein